MSICRGYWLVCDRCDEHKDQIANSVRQARQWAQHDGWRYIGAQRDLCPDCVEKGAR